MLKEDPSESRTDTNSCAARYLYPEPRVRMGLLLARNRAATAAHGSQRRPGGRCASDRAGQWRRRYRRSRGGADRSRRARVVQPSRGRSVTAAITGGDDYELLFAVRPRRPERLTAARRHGGLALTRIGVCTEDPAVRLSADAAT